MQSGSERGGNARIDCWVPLGPFWPSTLSSSTKPFFYFVVAASKVSRRSALTFLQRGGASPQMLSSVRKDLLEPPSLRHLADFQNAP